MEIYTHCGIDFDVDLDVSFWQLYPDSKTRGLATSFQIHTGTMTLLSDQVAVFHSEHQDEQRRSTSSAMTLRSLWPGVRKRRLAVSPSEGQSRLLR